eukprot:scaffold4731_cov175-Ochromonas_danica.AAC.7
MPVTTSAVAAANRIQGMGNDYVPENTTKAPAGSSGGFLTNLVSNIQSSIRGEGSETPYAGHPGATSSFDAPNRFGPGGSVPSQPRPPSGSIPSGSMTGIGNPNFRDAREDKTWFQKASEYASSSVGNVYSTTSNPVAGAAAINGDFTFATNRGPNAIDSVSNNNKIRNGFATNARVASNGNAWLPPLEGASSGMVPDLPHGAIGMGRVGPAASDGSYERSLIETLCEPGGLKAVPPDSVLQEFLQKAPTLSSELVGNCLIDSVNSDAWQSRIKALIVIASLIQAKDCSAHEEWWKDQLDVLRGLLADSKAGVRSQAAKTLRLLGEEHDVSVKSNSRSVTPKPTPTTPAASSAKNGSLIDFMDSIGESSPNPVVNNSPLHSSINTASPLHAAIVHPISPEAVQAPTGAEDMFAGLSMSDQNPETKTVTPPNIVSPSVPVPVASGGFDFLSHDNNLTAAPQPQPVAAPSSGAFDFFADLTPSINPLTATSSSSFAPSTPAVSQTSFSGQGFGRSPADIISSAFVNAPSNKVDNSSAFKEFSLPTANNVAPPPAPAQPIGAFQSSSSLAATSLYGQPLGTGVRPMTGSVLAPSMLNPTAPRKAIPTADSLSAANSGFSFLGSDSFSSNAAAASGSSVTGVAPARSVQSQDSFSFVTDAMKDLR